MSISPIDKSPEPDRSGLIRQSIVRSRLNIRVQLGHQRSPIRKRRIDARWVIIAMMLIGLIQGSYFFWAARSALAAAPIFRSDESCKPPKVDSLPSVSRGACRVEFAVVVEATYYSGRSGRTYKLVTRSADGTRNMTTLAGAQSMALWRRVQPTQRVVLQRFVAPGYYLTGKITTIADSAGFGMTRYHPDSRTHYEGMFAAIGLLMFACTFALLVL